MDSDPDRLELSGDEMRRLGHAMVEAVVAHFENLAEGPVGRRAPREELERLLREPIPETGRDPVAVLERIQRDILPNTLHVNHPRFFAFVPSPGNFVSAMADALASGFNIFAGTWFAGSAAAQIELVVTDWLREMCGLPEGAGGLFVSGGSMANLTALAAARHGRLDGRTEGAIVYMSDQTHSSVMRSLKVLGFAPEQIRILAADADFRLPLDALSAAIDGDLAAGLRPFCVVANAGTTNTGAVDPLAELADLCRQQDLWLHLDGAYGVPAILTEEGKAALAGVDLADSLSLDPHKWLFQTFESGCVLLRDRNLLLETFQVMPEYLRDTERGLEEVNFGNYGVQLTRSPRALKLWMSLQVFGLAGFRNAIARGVRLAELAEQALHQSEDWGIVTPAQLAVVTFRYRGGGMVDAEADALHGRVVEEMMAEGYALVTSTVLKGRPVLRLCTINPRTTDEEIEETIRRLTTIARRLSSRSAA
ncbi:MAG TPA: aminotransferase class I/II-fold pyridoxal phosphate-dependent enzyme [Allosphingosinicella sp.]|jgi:glutamate/tyrosine decarboxylase-like PLP-dependent enzyme|nr:aminotransferase class I/II-fold pyridoxal phosphate-dependent enzyme [Allosphingosinicella sp.]